MIYQVDIGYACFGVIVENGYVTEAAPIAKWMIGKQWIDVTDWILYKKHGKIKISQP